MEYDLIKTIKNFPKIKVLVIGEAMLDVYFKGSAERICREAPVPIVNIQREYDFAGGAANTASNVANLGGKTIFLSVLGRDIQGQKLVSSLNQAGVDCSHVGFCQDRETICKKRVVAENHLLIRFDSGTVSSISRRAEKEIIAQLFTLYPHSDLVIVSDYGYGILTENIRNAIFTSQHIYNKTLILDAKQIDLYKNIKTTLIKPNFSEAIKFLGINNPEKGNRRIDQLVRFKDTFFDQTRAEYVAITLDQDGAVIFGRDGLTYRTFSHPVANIRAAGAGDTYVAALGLALASSAPITAACEIGALAAGVILQKEGTASCTASELENILTSDVKVVRNRKRLARLVRDLRGEGKKIVFTNGCFDILHPGHIHYLSQAKRMGDTLIVGVNSDQSVKRLKGIKRPINSEKERMGVLAGLSSVDYLISFTKDTPEELISIIKPEVFVKGGDYTLDTLPEAETVTAYGGRVEILPYFNHQSTTGVISRIRKLVEAETEGPV